MIKTTLFSFVIILLFFSCSQVRQIPHKQLPSAIPVLNITNDSSAVPIKISELKIDASVIANIAVTTFDIVFENPNNRVLEGELEFPLSDGQNIIRYALDIDGKLREGIVVEKKTARVAFENTIRRKIDPGLIEKTKGNNFRIRVYPLPANGTRHIVIAVEQTLELLDKDLLYQLPLYGNEIISKFSINLSVIKSSEQPKLDKTEFRGFEFKRSENKDWLASTDQNNFLPAETISFTIPNSSVNETAIISENFGRQTYFYANNRTASEFKKEKPPSTIGVFWDISASSKKRDLNKEKDLLKEYLFQTGDKKITLVPFNIFIQPEQIFSSQNIDEILQRIDGFTYDGGTQFGAINFSNYDFEEILLFSDGLSTFGKSEAELSSIPITTIISSPSADYSYLRFIARQTKGKFIDLSKQEVKSAADEIRNESLSIIKVEFDPSEFEEIITQLSPIQNSGISFAGKLKTPSGTVKISLGFGNKIVTTKSFLITRPDSSDYNQVKRIWATMKIAELDLQFEKNKEEITFLGKEFSVVTQNTSLIVLDRVDDYVEHEITPPEELQKEYYSLLTKKNKNKSDEKKDAFNEALDAMKELREWWAKNYTPNKKSEPDLFLSDSIITTAVPMARISDTLTEGTRFSPPTIVTDYQAVQEVSDSSRLLLSISPGVGIFDAEAAPAPRQEGNALAYHMTLSDVNLDGVTDRMEERKKELVNEWANIELNEWKSDATYLKELEKVSAEERIKKYLSLKDQYTSQPSFFIDVARFFIEKKDKQQALIVLSNIAEMKLEDAELLRMVANQLLDAGEKDLAIETFREIKKIREEQPQSYRDLALALSETGNYDEALELLYKVITGVWDSRFGDVRSIAINEMNAIISSQNSVNTSFIDKRFIYSMPMDVRIVIGWSADKSDIDLWVTDPRNEKCFYSHTETEMGGKISQDVTTGYGPEEFCLKNAWKGKYTIEANLYGDSRQTLGGPIAIKAELFTDFGRVSQKREIINFRVTTGKEVVKIGSLKFDK